MGERVVVNGSTIKISREKGFLYFLKDDGNVWRTKMSRSGKKQGKQRHELLIKTGIVRDNKKNLYYIDSAGFVARQVRKGFTGGR